MRKFFGQYGKVTNIHMARSRKTGASKGYAFVEFADRGVAEIVASTMNGYIFFGRRLQVAFVPAEKVHPATFRGIKRPHTNRVRLHANHYNRARTMEEHEKRLEKQRKRKLIKQTKLQAMGIDYDLMLEEEGKGDQQQQSQQQQQQQQQKKKKKRRKST